MTAYPNMTREERGAEYTRVRQEFELWKAKGLKLNMARGKPGKQQLDLVSDIFSLMQDPQDYVSDGIDVRNYGELSGLPAAKRLFAEILGCRPGQVFVGGNASLQLMYDTISKGTPMACSTVPGPGAGKRTSNGSALLLAMIAISRSRSPLALSSSRSP